MYLDLGEGVHIRAGSLPGPRGGCTHTLGQGVYLDLGRVYTHIRAGSVPGPGEGVHTH